MRLLNLGCGYDQPDGWTNVDRLPMGDNQIIGTFEALPFPDAHFDGVVAKHALQMTPYVDLPAVFAELARVIRPGGILRVLSPDILRAFAAYKRRDASWFPIIDSAEPSLDGKFCAYLTWYSEARTLFTAPWLAELLARNGFAASLATPGASAHMTVIPQICDLDSRPSESVIVEGVRCH